MTPPNEDAPGVTDCSPMLDPVSDEATAHTLVFGDVTIPAVLVDGNLWIAATQLCIALNLNITPKLRAGRYLTKIPADQVDGMMVQTKCGLQPCRVITLDGAIALTKERTRRVDQRVRAMLNREAKPLLEVLQSPKASTSDATPLAALPPVDDHPPEATAYEPTTVTYNRKPVRIIMVDGAPWFVAADLYALDGEELHRERVATFAAKDRGRHLIATEKGDKLLTTVSALGAQTVAARMAYPTGGMCSAWVRSREAELLAPPGQTPVRTPLMLLSDGEMPPKPKFTDPQMMEWSDLEAASMKTMPATRFAALRRTYVPPRTTVDQAFYDAPDDDVSPRYAPPASVGNDGSPATHS